MCSDIVDCEHKTAPSSLTGFACIGTSDIKGGRIDLTGAKKVDLETYRLWTMRIEPRPGDLIMAREAPVGEVGRIPTGAQVCLGQRTVLLRPDPRSVDGRYLHYALLNPIVHARLRSLSEGSTVPHLNVAEIRRFELDTADFPDQLAIAETLGALDDKIELNRKTSVTLEGLARELFASWFGVLDPDRTPGGWTVGSLGDHVEVKRGLSYNGAGLSDDGIPLQNLDSIYEGGGYKYHGVKHYRGDYKDRHVARGGDLLVANTEQGFEHLLIGFPALVPERFGDLSLFSHHLYRVRPKAGSPMTARFLYLALMSSRLRQVVIGYSNGTTVNMLPADALQRPRLAVPPTDVVQRFDGFVALLFARQEQLQLESEKLAQLRDLLLPSLMSGNIRLKDTEKAVAEAL